MLKRKTKETFPNIFMYGWNAKKRIWNKKKKHVLPYSISTTQRPSVVSKVLAHCKFSEAFKGRGFIVTSTLHTCSLHEHLSCHYYKRVLTRKEFCSPKDLNSRRRIEGGPQEQMFSPMCENQFFQADIYSRSIYVTVQWYLENKLHRRVPSF